MTRDHVAINRDVWNADAENRVAAGERLWKAKTPIWGNWGVSDDTLMLLPEDLTGNDAILDAARDISLGLDGAPCDKTLHRPYRGMWGADWTKVEFDPGGVCFHLTISGWMQLFAAIGFAMKGYKETFAPDSVTDTRAFVPAEWAEKYPVEQVWRLEKNG